MRQVAIIIIAITAISLAAYLTYISRQNLGSLPAALGPTPIVPTTVSTSTNTTGLPLVLPPGFSISFFAIGLTGPRDLEFDPTGALLVSEPSAGRITALPNKITVISGLNRPHGLAFSGTKLYIAEMNAVAVYDYDSKTKKATNRQKIIDLPSGGNHWTRSLLIKDNLLYVATGSTCNVCYESDPRRSAIYVSDLDGHNFRPYASGLRNSVFQAINPTTNQIWVTEMGRDLLGDDLPPDEINILKENGNYGWPICFGQNIHDTNFDKNQYVRNPCADTIASHIDLPAHSAPLGMAFIPGSWPKDYVGDLLVSFHGSWNRSVPTGYKVTRFDLTTSQTKVGESDFIFGWLTKEGALGRPVDLIFDSVGSLFISDDKSGSVYKLTPPSVTTQPN